MGSGFRPLTFASSILLVIASYQCAVCADIPKLFEQALGADLRVVEEPNRPHKHLAKPVDPWFLESPSSWAFEPGCRVMIVKDRKLEHDRVAASH